jgi:hypothetical protein
LKADYVVKCSVNKPQADNNRVERLNGTLGERIKVQRAWKKHTSPLAEGQRIQYNFVKPHMALKGVTPAKKAGLEINGNDKWFTLLKSASAKIR